MKVEGTVKWFSNRKGYGFVTPTSDNKPTDEVIFVHQTGIISEGYRTLAPGVQVEFDVEKEETGKLKCVNVTLPGGAPIQPSALPRRPANSYNNSNSNSNQNNAETNTTTTDQKTASNHHHQATNAMTTTTSTTTNPKPSKEIPFHKVIAADVKAQIEQTTGLKLGENTTVDVAYNDARIKLGQGGYASMVLAEGVIAEGTYVCDATGIVTFQWEHVMKCQGAAWVATTTDTVMTSFSLADAAVKPVGAETAASLWGEDKPDPKDFFAPNGFKMKRVVLSRPSGNRGGGGGRRYPRRPRKAVENS